MNREAFGKRLMRDCETTPKPRIAFDLDETLGVPRIEGGTIVGFQSRAGCANLLEKLCRRYTLVLWTVSSRRYLDKVLAFGLRSFFEETYSWDELPASWKDIRKLRLAYLIDDSDHHREAARQFGLESGYLVVPAYGSPEDVINPLAWVRQIEQVLLPRTDP